MEALFVPNRRGSLEFAGVVEASHDKNCDIHGRRGSGGSVKRDSISSTATGPNKRDSISSVTGSNSTRDSVDGLFGNSYLSNYTVLKRGESIDRDIAANGASHPVVRRRSSGGKTTDANRKRYSWNPSSFKEIEHPSAFPSLLRGTTPVNDTPRPSSSLSRRDSHGSTHHLRRNDSNGIANNNHLFRKDSGTSSTPLTRRDSFGSGILQRKESNTAHEFARKNSADQKKANKQDGFPEDFRRLSFGNSIYLRPDSTGATNLIRRDSFDRRDSYDGKNHRIPRDYVSKALEHKADNSNANETNSILRRSSDLAATTTSNDDSKLTMANLSKHVTIWEKDGTDRDTTRRDSSGSLSNYLASRRISIDSLDVRRNSRRGSAASGDLNVSIDTDIDKEVS